MKVKIFWDKNLENLESTINEWLEEKRCMTFVLHHTEQSESEGIPTISIWYYD